MSSTDQVRPSQLRVPGADLADLRERLQHARLPEVETLAVPGGAPDRGHGGHFPMLEVPDSFVTELRRSLGRMTL